MSLQSRIQDATVLWQNGRHEGAILSALIAVAATSRLRYPDRNALNDREAFEKFLADEKPGVLAFEYRGEVHTLEHIIYKWLRCQLVHEGELPIDLELTDNEGLSVRAGGAPEFILRLSRGWFRFLVQCVVNAQENRQPFQSSPAKVG